MIDEKETLQPNPEMLLIMFNQAFIEHLLLIIFNRLQRIWDREMACNVVKLNYSSATELSKPWTGGIMRNQINVGDAETLAINALMFLADDSELLSRFLALTGITADQIRTAAGEPGFLAGVLQFYLGHEPTLMRYCEVTGTDPALFQEALRLLPGGRQDID